MKMKYLPRSLVIAALAAVTPAWADPPAAGPATRPIDTTWIRVPFSVDASVVGLNGHAETPAKTEKAAFLGVGVVPADATLVSQLDLPNGVGLNVVYVEDGSPAAQAGLQQHDVLHKLDDQLLVNVQQLATLVRTFKPGTDVAVTVIRKGKPLILKATLVERELPALGDASTLPTLNGLMMPTQQGLFVAPAVPQTKAWTDANANVRVSPGDGNEVRGRVIRISPGGRSTVVRSDEQHSIQLTIADGSRSLTIKDKTGKTLFDGPYNTDDEASKLPDELRRKVKQMLDGVEFKLVPATTPAEPKAELDIFPADGPSV